MIQRFLRFFVFFGRPFIVLEVTGDDVVTPVDRGMEEVVCWLLLTFCFAAWLPLLAARR